MDKKIIQAYLWRDVIRLGFPPLNDKEQTTWLWLYGKNLDYFLESGSHPNISKGSISFALPFNLQIDCFIEKTNKFNASFSLKPPSNNIEFRWKHEVDGKFFTFPEQEFLTHYNQRNRAISEFTDEDLKEVLDGLIFHPAAHQHIESPIDNHEIRIGGGLGNAFQFLFHLRYQLCPHKETREAEKKRLNRLFKDAIKNNSTVTIQQLMAQS